MSERGGAVQGRAIGHTAGAEPPAKPSRFGRMAAAARLGVRGAVLLAGIRPRRSFDAREPPPAPDYASPETWAARPDRANGSTMTPRGVEPGDRQASAEADVFFIHPTTYFSNRSWNAPLDDARTNELVDELILPLEASIFNGSCRVWAPRYRQATLYAFLGARRSARRALELAYGDVKRAFEHWVRSLSEGRPFFLASHSQGTCHAIRLLEEVIDRDPELADRMVAGYAIGFGLPLDKFERQTLGRLRPAEHAHDVGGVLVSWDTWSENGGPRPRWDRAELWYPRAGGREGGSWERRAWKKPLCINPLTWRRDGAPAPRESHRGAVVAELAERPARIKMLGNEPLGLRASGLSAPKPALVSARCGEDGYLYISEPPDPELRRMVMPGGNYHNYDMALFYMDIRHNVGERLAAWLERRAR